MQPNVTECGNRRDWLEARTSLIGASDVGIILGLSSFKSPGELWEEKRLKYTEEISNAYIEYGNAAEAPLRELFRAKNKDEYRLDYYPYRIYTSAQTPYMSATLDGELTRLSDEKKGVWECKTAMISSKQAYVAWKGQIPPQYYAQVCAQLYVTDWTYAVVTAELRFPDGDSEIKNYMIERDEESISNVVNAAARFWTSLERGDKPAVNISL